MVTAIALIIFNRKWICKQLSQCCLKLCVCNTNNQHPAPPPPPDSDTLDDLEDLKIENTSPCRWQHHHHNHFSELYHLHEHHDESKV